MRIKKNIWYIIIILIIFIPIIFYGGAYIIEEYPLHAAQQKYENNPDNYENISDLMLMYNLRAPYKEVSASYDIAEKYYEEYIKLSFLASDNYQTTSDTKNPHLLKIFIMQFYPGIMYLRDRNIQSNLYQESILRNDSIYNELFTEGQLNDIETKELFCNYAEYLPYLINIKNVDELDHVYSQISSFNITDQDCLAISQNELNDSLIIYYYLQGKTDKALELYNKINLTDINEEELENFANNYVFQLIKSDHPEIAPNRPELMQELDRMYKSNPIKYFTVKTANAFAQWLFLFQYGSSPL